MGRPSIIFYFPDQQRFNTCGVYEQPLPIASNLDVLAADGVIFEEVYNPQPVCDPCRALSQTGQYPTEIGCFRNSIVLPDGCKTLADYFSKAGYETIYIGKWHLTNTGNPEEKPEMDYTVTAVPSKRRGGYKGFWRAADVPELTSRGYDGYVLGEDTSKCGFKGYQVDCITDFVLEHLDKYGGERPFFITISRIEPHHQNNHKRYEEPVGFKERFSNYVLSEDLMALKGNADEMYPGYLGCCKSLDGNLGRLIEKLKERGLFENTVIVYASNHGSHFMTRNQDKHLNGYNDYRHTCHPVVLHVLLVIAGPGYGGGKRVKELVGTANLPKTSLVMTGVDVENTMIRENLHKVAEGEIQGRDSVMFAQISENHMGRCVRTEHYLYSVHAPEIPGGAQVDSDVYVGDLPYDVKRGPYGLHNLIGKPGYEEMWEEMAKLLVKKMEKAGEKVLEIRKS